MRKGSWKVFSVLLVFSLLLTSSACTGTSIGTESQGAADASAWPQRLWDVPELVFRHCEQGIGYGLCPVYTAPSEAAFRMANGRACVATDYEMWEGGYDLSGWLLVYFEANDGTMNVGYIPPDYVRGFESGMPYNEFDYVPVVAEKRTQITNNPMQGRSYFAVLDPGEEFFIIGKYSVYGNWWYVECQVDGRRTRGFMEKDSSAVSLGGPESASAPVPEADPIEFYPPRGGFESGSVVYPTEWDTQFRPGLTEKEYNLNRYKDLPYVGDDNYGTPYVWLIYSSERTDKIPELMAFFPGSTISEIGIRNGCLKNSTDYYRYARIRELEVLLYDSAGNVWSEQIALPDAYSTEYYVTQLSRTYSDIRRVDFFLKAFYYDENEDNGHKYLLYVSDIQFRQ